MYKNVWLYRYIYIIIVTDNFLKGCPAMKQIHDKEKYLII